MKLKVAACQIRTYPDVSESTGKIIEWIKKASGLGVDVVSFPEGTLFGYAIDAGGWEKMTPDDFLSAEENVISAVKGLDIAVIMGTAHWEGGRLYNSLLVIDRGGEIRGRYSKTHLVEDWPSPGHRLPIYSVAGVKSCFIICHDVRYPELVRLPAAAGAKVCYFCSNESGLLQEHKLSAYRAMPISRATENYIFLVMANAPADPDNIKAPYQSHGNSKIVHPDGNVLAEAGFFEECLVTAEIDTEEATGLIAKRALEDKTVLKSWMSEGVRLVEQ